MQQKKTLRGSSFSVLGDSYSTYEGWITPKNAAYYPRPEKVDDVLAVEHTWWHQLMTRQEMQLLFNESYSGTTVCTQVRISQPASSSYVARVKKYFSTPEPGKEPDFIFVFGGTNDSWLDRTPGTPQYADWTETDLKKTVPAMCFVLDHITRHNPGSVVVLVINTKLNPEIHRGMVEAGRHYGAVTVELADIDKQHGHPSRLGMSQIAQQVEKVLENL